jgi:23S rRNA (adenine2503-C2)-methyltransferase
MRTAATMERDIKDLTFEELAAELSRGGEPKFRTGQIFDWVYKKGAGSFAELTSLPLGLREKLGQAFSLRTPEPAEHLISADKAEKFLFRLADGQYIETVLIPAGLRNTLCLSSQVGCRYGCGFCASGLGGFKRNLAPGEMTGQILFLRDRLNVALTNFVFMGMGEPLDNFDNLVRALRNMNAPEGLGIAARRITISTAGVIPGINRLKEVDLQVNLSLSLHAVRDSLRSRLMPINRKYPLEAVLKACEGYIRTGGRMMTLEYVLLGGINDSSADARGLAAIAGRLRAKVNLIPYSEFDGLACRPTREPRQDAFLRTLEELRVKATVRRSKGAGIQAACGQLGGRLRRKRSAPS